MRVSSLVRPIVRTKRRTFNAVLRGKATLSASITLRWG